MKFELAQQLSRLWLGNPGESQVTRWREEWFKEGMATYMAYYLLAQVRKNHGTMTNMRLINLPRIINQLPNIIIEKYQL